MRIQRIVSNAVWSDKVRKYGLRKVAREAKMDFGYLSRVVNNKTVIRQKSLKRLKIAIGRLKLKQYEKYNN